MTEGQGRTAASVPGGADASDAAVPAAQPTPPVTGAPSPTGVAPFGWRGAGTGRGWR